LLNIAIAVLVFAFALLILIGSLGIGLYFLSKYGDALHEAPDNSITMKAIAEIKDTMADLETKITQVRLRLGWEVEND
jgi:hypothetical protein